ncbi:MAG: cyanophycinase [Bryobacteraceae bacterium]
MRLLLYLAASLLTAQTPSLYDYFPTGNPADCKPRTQAGLLLSGGGGDVDQAFQWFLRKAGGGDIVVLRASGADGYNKYLPSIAAVDSVESFVVKSRAASFEKFLLRKVRQAEGIFVAGGDQWNYISMWKTRRSGLLQLHYRRGRPIGGTSAGLAVLGEFSFSAQHDTVTSKDALHNPFHEKVVLEGDFLHFPPLRNIITDSHFSRRDRMGRLIVFVARMLRSGRANAMGVGVDEATAILVEPNGDGNVVGKANAYFLKVRGKPAECIPGEPLSISQVEVQKVKSGATFNFSRWKGGEAYLLSVKRGIIQTRKHDNLVY